MTERCRDSVIMGALPATTGAVAVALAGFDEHIPTAWEGQTVAKISLRRLSMAGTVRCDASGVWHALRS